MSIEDVGSSGAADTGIADASTQTSDPTLTTATDSGTTQGTPGENGAASTLTTDTSANTQTSVPPQAVQPAAQPHATSVPPDVNWQEKAQANEKRMNDALAHATRLYQEQQQLQAKYQPFANQDPQKVRQAMEHMEKAQALRPWNPRHPDYQRNNTRIQRAESYIASMRALPEDVRATHAQAALSQAGLTQDDVKLAMEKERVVQEETQQFFADPKGSIREEARQVVQEQLARFEQYQAARNGAQQMLSDPTNQALIKAHAPTMHQIMDPAIPAQDKAFFVGNLMAENAALRAQVQEKMQNNAQAEAQQAARRGKGGSRPPMTQPNGQRIADPYEYVTNTLKLQPGTSDFARELMRVNTGQ